MSATLQALTQAYENAVTARAQAESLLDLCALYMYIDPRYLLEYAEKAEARARKARFRKGIAAALKYVGMARIYLGGNQDGLDKIRASYDIYASLKDGRGMTATLCLLATGHCFNGAPDQARKYLLEAEQYCNASVPCKESVGLMNAWAGLYKVLGDPEKVIDYTRKMLAVAETIDDRPGMVLARCGLGSISQHFRDITTALRHFNAALQIACENGFRKLELDVLRDIASCHLNAGEFDVALDVGLRARSMAEGVGAEHSIIEAERLLCGIYQARSEYDLALDCAKRMTRLARTHSPLLLAVDFYYIRAELHRRCSQPEEALLWYERALEGAHTTGSIPYMMYAHQAIAQLYEMMGDLPTAYHHHREYMKIHEQLQGFKKQKAIASASVAIEVEQGERERERLTETMKRLESEIERKQQELTSSTLLIAEKDDMLAELRVELQSAVAMPAEESRKKLSSIVSRLGRNFNPTRAWEEFSRQFQIADPGFIKALTERFGHLTPTELKICSLLRVNLSTKDIASLLSVQPSSVDIYRSAIRRKLGLPKGENLTTFLGSL